MHSALFTADCMQIVGFDQGKLISSLNRDAKVVVVIE